MRTTHLRDALRCSAGTFASITGLRLNVDMATFSSWMSRNHADLPEGENFLMTIQLCWNLYSGGNFSVVERASNLVESAREAELVVQPKQGGMTVGQAKEYLNSRGLEALLPGGFSAIQRMQQGVC